MILYDWCPINRDIQIYRYEYREMPFGHEGRDWSDALTTHETTMMASKLLEAKRDT